MRKKVLLLYNPVSGKGRFKFKLDEIIYIFQKYGLQVIPWRMSNSRELAELAGRINEAEYHTVVVAGGDGSVNAVVNAFMKNGLNIPLGIFPEGTSNDVANYLKIPGDIAEYCRVIVEGSMQEIDVGQVNDNYFINVASAGFLTKTAHEVDYQLKNSLGRIAYYLGALARLPDLKTLQLDLTVDNSSTHRLPIVMFLCLNGGTVGGFPGMLPEGAMSDGVLDFLAIKTAPLSRLAGLLPSYQRGELLKEELVFYCKGRHFKIEMDCTVTDLDGEEGPELPWDIQVCPRALRIRIPG